MKPLALLLFLLVPSGDQDRGLQLYKEGKFEEAAVAFQQAIETEGDSAELSYNLALALWRAGDRDGAETAAERAATLSDGRLAGLRDGVLGNLRYELAQEISEQDLAVALQLAQQARDNYLRGSLTSETPELYRNLERAQNLIDELEKKLEEQQQEQEQEQEQGQEQEQEQEQDEEQQEQEQQEQEQQEQEQQDPQENEEQENQDEQEQENDEQQQEGQDQQLPEERNDAPGEQEQTELSPEQKQRLMDQLEEMEAALRQLRALQRSSRPKVERDW